VLEMRRVVWAALAMGMGAMLLIGLLALPAGAAGDSLHRVRLAPMVVINELAWAGTAAYSADEWIELYNPGGTAVDLTGWSLVAADGTPSILLGGHLPPYSFFLLERTDDQTVSDIPADQIYVGALGNSGERLELRDAGDVVVDSVNWDGGVWPGGSASPDYFSMERVNPTAADNDANWGSNNGVIRKGLDALGGLLNGTPKARNSITPPAADLRVVKFGPDHAYRGGEITYTLFLTNGDMLAAAHVWLTDTLPAGMNYLRHTGALTLTQPAGPLVFQVGALSPGQAVSFTLTAEISSTALGWATNTVQVSTAVTEHLLINNQASAGTWISLGPAETADLVLNKSGPTQVSAASVITYVLSLENTGQLSATSVLVTDVLPAVVAFQAQTSPYSFSQPGPGTLRWDAGTLLPGALVTWTVTGWVADGSENWLTNVVSAASSTAEANPADNQATWDTWAEYLPRVRLTAVHYWALAGDDEAVQISNLGGAPADIGGWYLSDGNSMVDLPTGLALAAGQAVWLAQDESAFQAQFGFAPDYVLASWPGLSNIGDEIILLDAEEQVQDLLVYGSGDTGSDGWSGSAVQSYHPGAIGKEGQILYRKLDQLTGRPIPDSDTAADWAQDPADLVDGRKTRYPGWDLGRFFFTKRFTETAKLTVVVGPDALYPAMLSEIESANESLLIQSYTFESTALAQAAAARAAAGLTVTLLLEGSPAGGLSDQERWVCQLIETAGGTCLFMINDSDNDIYDRYAHLHAKYLLIDGARALIGSENFSLESMPADDKRNGMAGRRGVYLITNAPSVVAHLETLFALDSDVANHRDIATSDFIGPPPIAYEPITATDWMTVSAYFTVPLELQGEFAFEIIQSPENSLRTGDSLLGLLARTGEGDTVLVQQLSEPVDWGENPVDDPNLRLEAYLAAARRGAQVRVLLDGYFSNENAATCIYLQSVAQAERLELDCQLGNPTGFGIHNKMVLAWIGGRGHIHVGSINGSELANKGNRELALQIQSDQAYAYLAEMFERDWPYWVYLPMMLQNYRGPADHVLISEVLYNPSGDDQDQEWVELYNPTGAAVNLSGWLLGDAVAVDDYEAMFIFPSGAVIGSQQILVVAINATRFEAENGFYPDYELLDETPGVPNLTRHPSWGTGDFALGNGGDELLLLDAAARPADVLTWGGGSYPAVLPHPGVALGGHSLERDPAWRDSDDCSVDFRDWPYPNPGTVPVAARYWSTLYPLPILFRDS